MASDRSHRKLAEKFALVELLGKTVVTDSLLALVRFTFTEEEAEIVAALGPAPLPVRAVALKLGRRAVTVRPVLESLAERVLILGLEMKGIPVYAFMPLVPGVFEAQMIRSRGLPGQRAHFEACARLYGDVHAEYSEILATQLVDRQVRTSRIIPIKQSIDPNLVDRIAGLSLGEVGPGGLCLSPCGLQSVEFGLSLVAASVLRRRIPSVEGRIKLARTNP